VPVSSRTQFSHSRAPKLLCKCFGSILEDFACGTSQITFYSSFGQCSVVLTVLYSSQCGGLRT